MTKSLIATFLISDTLTSRPKGVAIRLGILYLLVAQSILEYRKKDPVKKLPKLSALSFCLTVKYTIKK